MQKQYKWLIILVAHDDPQVQTRVIKERLLADADEELAAALRGGEPVAVLDRDDEKTTEAWRSEVERQCLR